MKSEERKRIIYDIFSKNLEQVKLNPEITFDPDPVDSYLCPLCLELFDRSHLTEKKNNYLTIEDVPPKSLGGNPKVLTCKDCNSNSGSLLDVHLLNNLLSLDAKELLPNSSFKTSIESDDGQANGFIEIDSEGKLSMHIDSKRSNPKSLEPLRHKMETELSKSRILFSPLTGWNTEGGQMNISFKLPDNFNERRAQIACLRIAYLYAFSIFGYSFIINGGLYPVREQILNPDKEILNDKFWINYEFPEKVEGLNLISRPKELKSFLVIFNLITKSKKRQCSILLPGPSSPGINIYKNLQEYYDSGGDFINIQLEGIPKLDYVKSSKLTWGSHAFWQKF